MGMLVWGNNTVRMSTGGLVPCYKPRTARLGYPSLGRGGHSYIF